MRYYLRGLGIGIIVTAIIMGITSKKEQADPGHVQPEAYENEKESGVLADLGEGIEQPEGGTTAARELEEEQDPEQEIVQPPDETTGANEMTDEQSPEPAWQTDDPQEEPSQAASPEPEEEPQTSPEPEEGAQDGNETADDGEEPEPETTSPDGASIVLEIAEGDSSYTVSRKLEEAGMVTSAAAFDTYLYDNGYDRRLRAGTYEIPVDTDPEDIAKILMN